VISIRDQLALALPPPLPAASVGPCKLLAILSCDLEQGCGLCVGFTVVGLSVLCLIDGEEEGRWFQLGEERRRIDSVVFTVSLKLNRVLGPQNGLHCSDT